MIEGFSKSHTNDSHSGVSRACFCLSVSTRCREDLHLSILSQQACVKSLFKVLSKSQISLKPDLVGPDQSGSWLAEMLHCDQELVQEVVMVDHISCQHVVVVIHRCRVGVLQVIAPGQSFHLGHVPATVPGVPHHVGPEVTQHFG